MKRFEEFQLALALVIGSISMLILLTCLYTFQVGTRPMSGLSYLIAFSIIAMMILLMYGMRTAVTEKEVTISFGLGLIRKRFPLGSIQEVNIVKNPWYYGWGIRIMPGGWLYNIQGLKAIELKLKSGRVARIGTRKPSEFEDAVRKLIVNKS